jgi:hypothetical protein
LRTAMDGISGSFPQPATDDKITLARVCLEPLLVQIELELSAIHPMSTQDAASKKNLMRQKHNLRSKRNRVNQKLETLLAAELMAKQVISRYKLKSSRH